MTDRPLTAETRERLRAIAGQMLDLELKGPWGWFGNVKNQSPYLATQHGGRQYVLGAGNRHDHTTYTEDYDDIEAETPADCSPGDCSKQRHATGRTHPRDTPTLKFRAQRDGDSHASLHLGHEIPVYEVARDATTEDDPRVYRHDVVGFRSPVADWFAALDADTVLALLDVADRASTASSASLAVLADQEREYVQFLNAALASQGPDDSDYHRWIGHAEHARQVCEKLRSALGEAPVDYRTDEWRKTHGVYQRDEQGRWPWQRKTA